VLSIKRVPTIIVRQHVRGGFVNEHQLETYKSLITISTEGYKFSALINGGAAVALLAYLGNAAGKGAAYPDMRTALAWFLGGLLSCGMSMFFAYLTQFSLLNEQAGAFAQRRHMKFLYVAMTLLFLSMLAFGVGSWEAVQRFK
jgi:hypothetical protein